MHDEKKMGEKGRHKILAWHSDPENKIIKSDNPVHVMRVLAHAFEHPDGARASVLKLSACHVPVIEAIHFATCTGFGTALSFFREQDEYTHIASVIKSLGTITLVLE